MLMARDFPYFNLSLPLPAKVLKNTIKIMISIQPENKSLFIKKVGSQMYKHLVINNTILMLNLMSVPFLNYMTPKVFKFSGFLLILNIKERF